MKGLSSLAPKFLYRSDLQMNRAKRKISIRNIHNLVKFSINGICKNEKLESFLCISFSNFIEFFVVDIITTEMAVDIPKNQLKLRFYAFLK